MFKIELLNNPDFLSDIAEIEKETFNHPWSLKMLEESFKNGCYFIILRDSDNVAGYGGLYPTGDITNIAVKNQYRGLKYGQKILQAIIDIAKRNNINTIFLEVRESNKIAINLYEKNSFKNIAKREKYYEDGETALIYSLEV